ncbi:PqqD family protein [Streptomyces monticola]|uniref:PqqD family protein n=1 Tax=Streptomyces monticola TaxID=2666263 RepID=A0ABW2JVQ3_9ACTN
MPGVSVNVDMQGHLELLWEAESVHSPGRYRCSPVGTAMWIALRQHDGNVSAAASTLAGLWDMAPANARADLDIWVGEMRDAGLVYDAPCA